MNDLPKKGEFCLTDFEVVKFQGCLIEPEDSYYTLLHWGGRTVHSSQCGTFLIRLKLILSEKEYSRIDSLWKMNKYNWNKKPTPIFMNGAGDYIFRLSNDKYTVITEKTLTV